MLLKRAQKNKRKWIGKLYKLTNVTVFAALLSKVTRGMQRRSTATAVYKKNHTVNCVTYEEVTRKAYNDNLCLLRALALQLRGNEVVQEKTSRMFTLFLEKNGGTNPASFQGVCMIRTLCVEDLVKVNIFLYDLHIVDEKMIVEYEIIQQCSTITF